MQISTTRLPMAAVSQPAQAAQPEQTKPEAVELPGDSFTFSNPTGGRYSGTNIVSRAVGGAITGALAHYMGDGTTWGTAKLGATVNGVIGGGVGALGGALVGGASAGGGGAATGAVIGAVTLGVPSALIGGAKGALLGVLGNALGGGPVAFAASGALLGVI